MNIIWVCQAYGDNPPKRIIKTLLVCRPIPLRFIGLIRAHMRHVVPCGKAQQQRGPDAVTHRIWLRDGFVRSPLSKPLSQPARFASL